VCVCVRARARGRATARELVCVGGMRAAVSDKL
jgi:hypothetical protein